MCSLADDPLFFATLPMPWSPDAHEEPPNGLQARRADRQIASLRKALAVKEDELRTANLRVAELEHRVANELQILSSLMRLQAEKENEQRLPDSCAVCVTQVRALADLHRALALGGSDRVDLADYLGSVVRQIRSAFRLGDRIGIELVADSIAVRASKAQTLALMVNEAVANALKHAFPGHRAGTVRLTLVKEASAIRFSVSDDGDGTRTGESEPRLRIIRALAAQLGGELVVPAVEKGFQIDCVFAAE
jgi:two-component sensor histidine kinase